MKKNLLFAASILAISGFLAACGTDGAEEQEPAEDTASTPEESVEDVIEEETDEDTPADDVIEEEPAEEDVPAESDESTDDAGDVIEEEPAEDTVDTDDAVEETVNRAEAEGTLTESDEQSYQVYVLPGYELTSEEPGKDSLYLAEDGGVFMRVETFDPATLDFTGAKDALTQTLEASTGETNLTEGSLDGDFVNSAVYETSSDGSKVTGVVFEKENLVVRLTIFDSAEGTATADFVEMGKTVQPIQ